MKTTTNSDTENVKKNDENGFLTGYKPVDPSVSLPEREEKTIEYWQKNKIFEKSVAKNPKEKKWNFLDGPPFVTGMPHYGTLLSSLPKDVFPRFWTMKGYHVRRVWGWDGHGLPIENKVEGELKIERKKDIEEKVGIKVFIERCLHYVNQVSSEWEWYVDHVGRWVDFKNAYKTWDLPYMESVMWVFKQMYEKGYVYKGLRVSLYCPHCSTPISNFEVAMDADNHREVAEPSTTYKYELKTPAFAKVFDRETQTESASSGKQNSKLKTYILAWSTTPWNKIVTTALAINPEFTYVKVRQGDEYFILAKTTLKMLKEQPAYEIVEELKGKDLVGKKFEPHYNYYPVEPGEKVFEIIADSFVTAEEGTGVVTIAAYGEEDLKVMKEQNVHIEMHLDDEGNVKPDVPLFGGMYYLKANKYVNDDLGKRGLIYGNYEYKHTMPFCWRCHTRLYYAPQNAWYVNIQELKPLLKETNEDINWFPKHFKYGRFMKSLESAPDWNISRNRYWGSPVPVWECECGQRFVPGSIKELEEASGKKIANLHKPDIDEVTVLCKKCGKTMHRTPEVLDSWIEAGSASFAERHFPFNTLEKLEDFFPPDFIVEYTGQIRAWFYVLHVIGAALYRSKAFKNVAVTGVILGSDGRKMSKNFKNYPDPKEMLQKYGGDALRLYLLGCPVMRGEDILISEEQYRNQVRGTLLILWNVYNFFVTYANVDKWDKKPQTSSLKPQSVLDQWIVLLLQQLITDVTKSLEAYDTFGAIEKIQSFVTDLSTWYIRRSRDRVGPSAINEADKNAFYETCWYVLTTLCKVAAPIIPFITEEIYRNLTGEESVHLEQWPEVNKEQRTENKELEEQMKFVRKIVEMGLAQRKEHQIKVRQPLKELRIKPASPEFQRGENQELRINELEQLIKDELNVKNVVWEKGEKELEVSLDTSITPELKAEGEARDLVRKIQEERKKLGTTLDEKVNVTLSAWPKEYADYIKQQALVEKLENGEKFTVLRNNNYPFSS